MIRKFLAGLASLFDGDNTPKPMATRPTRRMEDYRISYSRDGRYFLQGWLDGAYMASDYIKEVKDGIITDVMGHHYSLGNPDGGEWAYSLRLRWPQGYQWFYDNGAIPT